ncbi:MAG: nicotinate-nucleotide adenylyltransferase [Actinomycetota bacterium]
MTEKPGRLRLGIMGGTFDPIHIGHLVCAEEARWQFALDEVIWVPAGMPWQKEKTGVSPAEDRHMMVVLATENHPSFSVSRIEIDRRGSSYTLDTLKAFRSFYGDRAELFFITGADAVLQILSWKDPDEVLGAARFIAATRPDYDLAADDLSKFGEGVTVMEIPGLDVSSTAIRRRVSEGRPIRYLAPDPVADYIAERGLYRQDERERSA